jgi:hypothetical protein
MSDTNPDILAALKAAEDRAKTESEAWIPTKSGDGVTGKVVGLGRYMTQFGVSPFVELEIPDGITVKIDGKAVTGKLYRVGFMGVVMEKSYETFVPTFGDYVSCQYLGDRPQRNEMNDYKLVQTVVLNPDGTPKLPVDAVTAQQQLAVLSQTPVLSATEAGFEETDPEANKPF